MDKRKQRRSEVHKTLDPSMQKKRIKEAERRMRSTMTKDERREFYRRKEREMEVALSKEGRGLPQDQIKAMVRVEKEKKIPVKDQIEINKEFERRRKERQR